jgi:hypothetical protein
VAEVVAAEQKKAEANRLIAYHSPITAALNAERTSLESALIPVSAYIVVACVEAWHRYPDLVREIDAALPVEDIALAGHHPGSRINTVHLWGVANFYLVGRNVMLGFGGPDDPERAHAVLDFWERAAKLFRGDGTRQAWDAGGVVRPYGDDIVARLLDGVRPVETDDTRARVKRLNATLANYLFLMFFDTRVGTSDVGPYRLPDGRTLLVRDFYNLSHSDFWWSDVARDVPYRNLTAALVLDDVELTVSDYGTAYTKPEDYLDRLSGFGLFTSDTTDGSLREVAAEDHDELLASVRAAQAAHYRNVVAMSRDEKIRCGAYVYFSFLRPFAEVAGIADRLDWTVPRDMPEPFYELLSQFAGDNSAPDAEGPYYPPIA